MMQRSRAAISLSVAALAGLLAGGIAAAADWRQGWATLHNERHGFLIAYPAEIFQQQAESRTDEGRVLLSRDGKAQLLVGAFANDEATIVLAYPGGILHEARIRQDNFTVDEIDAMLDGLLAASERREPGRS